MTTAYPLAWPDGWPRTPSQKRENDGRFGTFSAPAFDMNGNPLYRSRGSVTVASAIQKLCEELARLKARDIVISTNVELRQDGLPYSNRRTPNDPGAAVYFTLKGKSLVMASDRYLSVAGNLRSIGLGIEAMRQLERHGGGAMMERAFSGFAALTAPNADKPWREVFGSRDAGWRPTRDELDQIYRTKARERHPDAGGSGPLMAELNAAYETAKREIAA